MDGNYVATRSRVHGSRQDLDQCVRPGFLCRPMCPVAKKCTGTKKYESFDNIIIDPHEQEYIRTHAEFGDIEDFLTAATQIIDSHLLNDLDRSGLKDP